MMTRSCVAACAAMTLCAAASIHVDGQSPAPKMTTEQRYRPPMTIAVDGWPSSSNTGPGTRSPRRRAATMMSMGKTPASRGKVIVPTTLSGSVNEMFPVWRSATTTASLATSYATAGTTTSAPFTFNDNGSYTIYGRIFDNDGGYTQYTTTVVVNLKKGTYHFYCSVPGHEDAGMAGTLIVS